MRLTVLLVGALLCVLLQPADARPRTGHHHRHHIPDSGKMVGCSDPVMRPCNQGFSADHRFERASHFRRRSNERKRIGPGLRRLMAEGAGRIVSHPAGCPRRSFCGCGAAVRIFGKPIRSLWLAAEWLRRFPRAQAARGMAAVRRDGHHIVVLEEHISGALWRVYDANSGRHRTRVHLRSIAGWTIVDPRAGA